MLGLVHVAQLVNELIPGREAPRRLDEVIDAREENKQPVPPVLQRGEGLADIRRIDRHPGVAGADTPVEDQVFGDHCRGVIPCALIRSCRIISALSKSSGRGGQPGMYTWTGTILSTPWRSA